MSVIISGIIALVNLTAVAAAFYKHPVTLSSHNIHFFITKSPARSYVHVGRKQK
jgi:hypothetical protein